MCQCWRCVVGYLTHKETTVLILLPFWAAPSGLFVGPEISFVLAYSHSFNSCGGGGALWLQPNMPLPAFPLNLQPRGEMFLISVGNYLKSLTQQTRDFNSVLSNPLSSHEIDSVSHVGLFLLACSSQLQWLVAYLDLATKHLKKSSPERERLDGILCVPIVAGSEGRAYSNSLRFTFASVAWLILSTELV